MVSAHQSVLIGSHAARLGVDYTDAIDNLSTFADMVGMIENDGRTTGSNKDSTAKGLYQFINDSVEPAVNRLKKYVGMQPWMKEALKHKNANKLTREQQTLLLLGDLLEKTAIVDGEEVPGLGDKFMKGVMSGDKEAMKQAYYMLHHTDPDKATIDRVNKFIK